MENGKRGKMETFNIVQSLLSENEINKSINMHFIRVCQSLNKIRCLTLTVVIKNTLHSVCIRSVI